MPGGLCVTVGRPQTPGGPGTITLLGWDGQPRWTITAPLRPQMIQRVYNPTSGHALDEETLISLSRDGHVFALCEPGTKPGTLRVRSWRDGRLLGEARVVFACAASRLCYDVTLQVLDSGRLWLYDTCCHNGRVRLCAIDGALVQTGQYRVGGLPSTAGSFCAVSPNGTGLLCVMDRQVETAMLGVAHGRVRTEGRFARPNKYIAYHWLDDERLIDEACSTVIEVDGTPRAIPPGTLRLFPTTGRPWTVRTGREFNLLWTTADARTALLTEGQVRLPASLAWLRNPRTRWLLNLSQHRLALYTAPGRLRAVLPVPTMDAMWINPYEWRLSPDGRRVATLVMNADRSEIALYGWGKD
jgi:hypothetical protein